MAFGSLIPFLSKWASTWSALGALRPIADVGVAATDAAARHRAGEAQTFEPVRAATEASMLWVSAGEATEVSARFPAAALCAALLCRRGCEHNTSNTSSKPSPLVCAISPRHAPLHISYLNPPPVSF